ncbi:MAG: DUF502 domain-containing protein, partial [Pseudomonadota bacterium]
FIQLILKLGKFYKRVVCVSHESEPDKHGPDAKGKAVPKDGFGRRLRRYFLTGILVTVPIFITFTLALWLIELIDSQIIPLIPAQYHPETYFREIGFLLPIPGLGVIILVVFITFVGFLAAGFVGRYVVNLGERLVHRMPVLGTIYGGSKQILETVLRDQSQAFRQAVIIEYPRKGIWAIAFVTGDTAGEMGKKLDNDSLNLFLPTTPNPTSGFLLFVPRKDVIALDMSIDQAVKLVISAGIITPSAAGEQDEEIKEIKGDG